MNTIKQILAEFLKEQQARLKPRTYEEYEDVIYFFEQYLNSYAYEGLDEKDSKLFNELYDEDKQFCEIFGPDKICSPEISYFLDYFLIRKVIGSKELMKTAGRIMRKFVKWMNEKGYMDEKEYKETAERVDELKDELPKVEELSGLIYDYIRNNPPKAIKETKEGHFTVTKVKPGELWLEDYTESGKEIGPVLVSNEISSMCKAGWVICLELGKTSKGWQMIESGNVYPE